MSMTWNSENRMTESISQNIYSGAKTLTRYKYDHEGNRVVKSSNYGEVVTPSAEISYRNDSIVTKHIFVSGVRVASKVCDEKSSNTYYQSVDHLGSTNVLTDDKGEFYEHVETFPDGSIWVKEYVDQSGVNAVFTCHEMDVETKFFYATSRYYDASLSVFISTDDRFDGLFTHKGLNVYSYCHHNPVKFVDPDGHEIYGSDSGYGSSGGYYGTTQSGTGNVSETNTTNQPYMQSDYGANSQFYGNTAPSELQPQITAQPVAHSNAYVSSGWYRNNPNYRPQLHGGGDIAFGGASNNEPARSIFNVTLVAKGFQTNARRTGGYGNYAIMRINDEGEYHNMYLFYGHMRDPVEHDVGTDIEAGGRVGIVGGTGRSNPAPYAIHLHIEIRRTMRRNSRININPLLRILYPGANIRDEPSN